jgi:hypothetical protein
MAKISDAEVRRLLSYSKQYIDNEDLAGIEDELRGDYAEEYLREPDLLKFFPELNEEILAAQKNFKLRVIPHAHLRMVQRGVKLGDLIVLFRSFIESYSAKGETIVIGHYALYGYLKSRKLFITLRVDIDAITDVTGEAHVVTIYMGRGNNEGILEVDLPIQ